jgi:hypothetical protein
VEESTGSRIARNVWLFFDRGVTFVGYATQRLVVQIHPPNQSNAVGFGPHNVLMLRLRATLCARPNY